MAEKKPMFDLNTLIERPVVNIDGQPYELVHPDEMTVLDRQRQAVRGRRIAALMALDRDLTEAEQNDLPRMLDEACRAILVGAPPEIHAKLQDGHRFSIIDSFGVLLLKRSRQTAGALM